MTRRTIILRTLLALLLGTIGWASVTATAFAGGPTSVLLVGDHGRANALYVTDPDYERLHAAVGGEANGDLDQPPGMTADHEGVRVTWLVHDVRVWRIDMVHLTGHDGIWVQTFLDPSGEGYAFDQPARWHRPQDDKALMNLLTTLGLLGSEAEPATAPSNAPAAATSAGPGRPLPMVLAAGLGGLVIGAAGSLLLRRRPAVDQPRVTLSG